MTQPFFSDKGFNTDDGNVRGYNHYVGNANGRIQFTNYYSRISEQSPTTGQDYQNVPTVTVTGGGSGLLASASFTYGEPGYYNVNNNDGGTGYAIGDTVKIPGTTFFNGTSPANDVLIQVDSLYPASTAALDISLVSGTPPTFPEGVYVNNNDQNYWVFKTDGTLQNSGNITSSGNVTAKYFIGDGSQLTNVGGGGNASIGNWVFDANDATVNNTGYPRLFGGPNGGPEFSFLEEAGNNASVSQTMYINNEDGFRVSLDNGNNQFQFSVNGTVLFPTLTVDLHNGGNQSAQTLQFGDTTQQAIITGPTPTGNDNAQRLIIQGQRGAGTGEGGDVYFWAGDADTNGGDIKIYAGDADNVSSGTGGYINIEGGRGFDNGGGVTITAGQSLNGQGAYATFIGGQGGTTGGGANVEGGFGSVTGGGAALKGGYGGNGPGGNVTIVGGGSANGYAQYGNVTVEIGTNNWVFDNTGNLQVPTSGYITTPLSTGGGAGYNVNIKAGDADQTDYYSTVGGNVNIIGGLGASNDGGGGGQGGSVNIAAGVSSDPAGVPGNVTINTFTNAWTFDYTGNVTLPGGGTIFGNPYTPSGAPGNTITLQPAGSGVTTDQKLMIYPTAADGDHIHLTSGNLYQTELFLGNDNFYVKLANTGNVVINSNDDNGNVAQWTFNAGGYVTFPDNTTQDTAAVAEAPFGILTADFNAGAGARYGVDTTSNTVTATLPASPATGVAIFFADAGGAYATNNLIINPNGGTIMGASGNMTVSTNNQSVGLFYNGTTWRTYNAG